MLSIIPVQPSPVQSQSHPLKVENEQERRREVYDESDVERRERDDIPAVTALVYSGRATREARYRASRGLYCGGTTFLASSLLIFGVGSN